MFYMAPVLNVPKSIREDDIHHSNEQEKVHKNEKNGDDDGDLIFG